MNKIQKRQLEAINYHGPLHQLKYMQTEVFEMSEAIINFENGVGTIEHVIEEVGDVKNMLEQIILYYEILDEELEYVEDFKTARHAREIEKEKANNKEDK